MLGACAVASSAVAAPLRVQARQDHSVESSFALDFGPQGGVANALISRTDFELEIDGAAGSARFLSYDQDIDALLLPGGLSTGAIRVQIVPGSSTGAYNRATGAFVTDEIYNIEFEGDLSAYGLFSPVTLPSQSVGVVRVDNATVGNVTMNWAGSNLNNPSVPIDFSYICTLFASFAVNAPSYIEAIVTLMSDMTITPLLRAKLIVALDAAIVSLNNEDVPGAVASLEKFKIYARNGVPIRISQSDALLLIDAANGAILLAQPPRDPLLTPQRLSSDPSDKGGTGTIR